MSALRSAVFLPVAASLLAVILLGWFFLPMPAIKQITWVTIGSTTLSVEVADTNAAREQGLSGRDSLKEGSGMLFVFDEPQTAGFWMKDMKFSLDILFADASGNIITIEHNISPATYQQNPPEVFYSSAPAKYVLEVPAGFAKAHGISVGQKFVLQ